MRPLHTIEPVMCPGFTETFDTLHPGIVGTIAPYLSIISWAKQTAATCGVPLAPPGGIPSITVTVVSSHNPGFRCVCAEAAAVIKQQPITIEKIVQRIYSLHVACTERVYRPLYTRIKPELCPLHAKFS